MSPKGPLELFDILQLNGCSQNPKGSPFIFFGTMRLFQILIFHFFQKEFYCLQWVPLHFFISHQIGFSKNLKHPDNFQHCEIFTISVLKFSQHAITEFFLNTGVFFHAPFSNLFLSKPPLDFY